jgi:hypothetical protein
MNQRFRRLAILCGVGAVLVAVASCGSTTTHHVLTGKPSHARGGDVRVVMESAEVPAGIDEVAIVQAVGQGTEADLEHVIEGLKEEARALGCDVVVRVRIDQGSSTAAASGVAGRLRR